MGITVTEAFGSRPSETGESNSTTRKYFLVGSNDEDALLAALDSVAPATALTAAIPKKGVRLVAQLADYIWSGEAQYGDLASDPPMAAGDNQFSFEIGTESVHVLNGISTRNAYPVGAPDLKGAINYDGEKVNGVDILMPKGSFAITKIVANATVSSAYKAVLATLTGQINDDTFQGYEAREVLLAGVQGTRRDAATWELTFRFLVSKKKSAFAVGAVAAVTKEGWDYLWVRYKTDADANALVQQPVAVYCVQVYEEGDFDTLGL